MQGSLRGLLPPLARIDFVFTNSLLIASHAEVWSQSHIADHRPLVVELAIVGGV